MLSRLSFKLLLPSFIIGFVAILLVVIFGSSVSKESLIGILSLLIIVQFIAGYIFSQQQLTNRIAKLKQYLDAVVSVDQAPAKPLVDNINDDFGVITNELSTFISSLAEVLKQIREESVILRQGSERLLNQMENSVRSVDESVNQIDQMAQSIEHVASTSTVLSENALQVSETTNQVMTFLQQGTASSNTSQKSIESFAREVNEMAGDLVLLQEECSRIGSVLDVIRGIADQTNLLALNAAIEAARAGEQGRGFAVVADEVRALAHRTQESTVVIQSMVEGLQEKSTNAVNAINRGQSLTQESLSYSEEVVAALEKIGAVFTEIDTLTSQIAIGTDDQQQSTASINNNMSIIVSLSKEINAGLVIATQLSEQQHETSEEVDTTLNLICV